MRQIIAEGMHGSSPSLTNDYTFLEYVLSWIGERSSLLPKLIQWQQHFGKCMGGRIPISIALSDTESYISMLQSRHYSVSLHNKPDGCFLFFSAELQRLASIIPHVVAHVGMQNWPKIPWMKVQNGRGQARLST